MDVVRPIRLVNSALLARSILHALTDQRLRLRVQRKLNTQRARRTLAGVIVRRGTNATG